MEHELWLTSFLNQILGKPVTGFLLSVGITPESPDHPIKNYFAMELLVVIFIMALLAWLGTRLSVDRPGRIQQFLEVIIDGIGTQCEEIIGHGSKQFVPLLFTLALFIFPSNVMGEIPHLETPTSVIQVTLGCALVAFVYYNAWGIRHHGPGGYIKTFLGPVWWLAPLMLSIELISHLARALSLSVRLYANMLAGENITDVFRSLVPVGLPSVFMALHVAVGALQTFIFLLLTTVYLAGAVSHEH
jgi:F-type H+-transporting ATPase subunit a